MAVEYLTALYVTDDNAYQEYREAMMPILTTYKGGFSYDFKVSEVLKSETENSINRVFIMYIESEDAAAAFFSDPDYLKIRAQYFNVSVPSITNISMWEKN